MPSSGRNLHFPNNGGHFFRKFPVVLYVTPKSLIDSLSWSIFCWIQCISWIYYIFNAFFVYADSSIVQACCRVPRNMHSDLLRGYDDKLTSFMASREDFRNVGALGYCWIWMSVSLNIAGCSYTWKLPDTFSDTDCETCCIYSIAHLLDCIYLESKCDVRRVCASSNLDHRTMIDDSIPLRLSLCLNITTFNDSDAGYRHSGLSVTICNWDVGQRWVCNLPVQPSPAINGASLVFNVGGCSLGFPGFSATIWNETLPAMGVRSPSAAW